MKYPTQSELEELSASDRLRLLEDVWETFVRNPDSLPLSDEHRREIDRRLEAFNRDPSAGATWDEVKQRIKQRR